MQLTLLIANYNNGHFFRDCYQSIIAQTCQDWVAVILDDGSTDNSVQEIQNLINGDPRFLLYQNDRNRGVGYTKSRLIELAETEICGFVDPDDALAPTAVGSALEVFRRKKEVVLTYSRPVKCDRNLQPMHEIKAAMQVPNGDPYFFNCPVQIMHFVAFRKNIYEQCEKMDEELKIAEDQDLYLKMYEKGRVHFINDANYLYRTHDRGISQNENKKKSYEYWSKVIWKTMKRRSLTQIHGKKVPENFTTESDIFGLLQYQNSLLYRLNKKLRLRRKR